MDSKTMGKAIFAMCSIVLLVVLVVLYTNRSRWIKTDQSIAEENLVEETDSVNGNDVVGLSENQIGNDLRAFENDPEFFDVDNSRTEDEILRDDHRLVMILTSVEKDLRIQIQNLKGEMVTGETFQVTLLDKGTYKDVNQDGIIYVSGLKAAEYEVKLEPIDGYYVPENATRINVKESVEYFSIADISLLIKTEDEINPEKEDTGIKEALSDSDKTEITGRYTNREDALLGIDVSKWNKEIDWNAVAEEGVDYAIIRVGYRGSSTGSLVEDPYFQLNISGARRAGIPVGVYFFTQAVNEVEAVEEASMVLSLLGNRELTYPVFIDTEGAGGAGRADRLDAETRTAVCKAFCDTIQNEGYQAGIYASKNWMNNRLEMEELEDYFIWLAEYREVPTYEGYYDMWQYTSRGQLSGIDGNVDMNISYLKIE